LIHKNSFLISVIGVENHTTKDYPPKRYELTINVAGPSAIVTK